ncbi:hypothetical protein R1sor_013686 [Riccia sorocarpa]|uniref:Transposase n=1 Tax=Riccia sorocarpa TaxID=122646 RepID=A0ABD3H797_9MARC
MQNAMHKVLKEFVPEITIPFLDDIPMKGCATEEKDETVDATGCRKRPNPVKVEAIARLADCRSTTEVRRFLESCVSVCPFRIMHIWQSRCMPC